MKSLQIYNTLSRSKQVFIPRHPGEVRMYVCGITVYDYCHIGHARMIVIFNLVRSWLRTLGYKVTYVRNITDIDDKIIRRASENGETIHSLTERFISAMHKDVDALGIEPPDYEPRATEFITQMLNMIEVLEVNGYAYYAKDGDINYSVRKFFEYGKLSGKSLRDLQAGWRLSTNDSKEDPLDFVLWKRAKPSEPDESSWPSKYGSGRPGWHIECSAMSCALLGDHFDIHGGGQDLQFPHHENEIAQSEGATGKTFSNYWMHNGFVEINSKKMSKSFGNVLTIRQILKNYDAEVIRFFIIRTHYRSPINYSSAHLDEARTSLTRLYITLKNVNPDSNKLDWNERSAQLFMSAMNDDFNTPFAVTLLFQLANDINRTRNPVLARQLKGLAGSLGLLQIEPSAFLHGINKNEEREDKLSENEIELRIAERNIAKMKKDYFNADRIRSELFKAGILLEDKFGGLTEWRRIY
ncbi:MAG: cysteine--tRNA ligase [Burkholderia sp.]|nr:cysteine--tRNA ligase [Burkholderia sp.]